MSLNWIIVMALAAIGLAWSNPKHSDHHAALSPVFLEFINDAHGENLKAVQAAWTFLPKTLDYRNYYLFSTTAFPGNVTTAQTPAEGTLTLGLLGRVIVLFPKSV